MVKYIAFYLNEPTSCDSTSLAPVLGVGTSNENEMKKKRFELAKLCGLRFNEVISYWF